MKARGARSFLYVPGDRPDLMRKARMGTAAALILDLEDAVTPAAKDEAILHVREYLAWAKSQQEPGPQTWVRVNAGQHGLDDIAHVASPELSGFCMAKTEGPVDVTRAATAAAAAEALLRLPDGAFRLMPLLETGRAILQSGTIASASPRVAVLQIGEADLCADVGILPGPDGVELLFARSYVVMASAAAGVAAPVAPVSTDYADMQAFRRGTTALRSLGYGSRACIHPSQVDVVNDVMKPTVEELLAAQRIVDDYHDSVAAGKGVVGDGSGRMVDLAVVRQAMSTLEQATHDARGEAVS